MTRIPFAKIRFPRENLSECDVEGRLKRFLSNYREKRGRPDGVYLVDDTDRRKIQRRTQAYLRAVSRSTGMGHLRREDRETMEVFRHGIELKPVETEHRADEIASALHVEMPWMAAATERVWHDMRASVRNGDPAPRLSPLLLVGPPGIGKSHWARLLGDSLLVPTTVVEATGEPASFAVTGSQRGWSNAEPGKPLQGIMASGIANPIVVVDEIEKAGFVQSSKGRVFSLTDGLLPLLERSTAERWSCPYFRVCFDMSWIGWVMTANSLRGLSGPFLSRCPPLELGPVSVRDLKGFADRETARRGLPGDAVEAVHDTIDRVNAPQLLSLRSVVRLVDAAERVLHRSVLH